MVVVGVVGPWAGTAVEHQFQSPAMLGGVVDGQDFHNGFVEAADPAATAAVKMHMDLSVSKPQAGGWDEGTGQLGRGGLGALHDHLHRSEGKTQQDIQDPLGSVVLDSDDVGVGNVAAQRAHCSVPLDSPG